MDPYIKQQLQRRMASGGRVEGPGTGTSDSIPVPLKDKRGNVRAPAALSDGEFVIKANTVSNVGGGATNGGFDFFEQFVSIIDQLDRESAQAFAESVLVLGEVFAEEQPKIDEEVTV